MSKKITKFLINFYEKAKMLSEPVYNKKIDMEV
jgi:hypothetical protein